MFDGLSRLTLLDRSVFTARRLSLITLEEAIYRGYLLLWALWQRLLYYLRSSPSVPLPLSPASNSHRFIFDPSDWKAIRTAYVRLFPGGVERLVQEANAFLAHRHSIFDRKVDLGNRIDWHLDVRSGRTWPRKFYADLDPKDKRIGAVKYVWELNRHAHFYVLGRAYFLTRDERYAREICNQIEDWIEQNPYPVGINWVSPLEMAIRMIAWFWVLHFVEGSSSMTRALRQKTMESIWLQANFIEHNLSLFSSANNHLIGEAAGLAFAGQLTRFPESEGWKRRGLSIICREVERQVHEDGVPAEQSSHYATLVLDFYLFVLILFMKCGRPFPRKVADSIAKMCEFLKAIGDSRGKLPMIGDSDDAELAQLGQDAGTCESLLTTASVILERPDLRNPECVFDEKSFWLLGETGHEASLKGRGEVEDEGLRVFARGGYAVHRQGSGESGTHLIFDCGPLGYLSTAAHGHADTLSFTLSVGGREFLIDPGTYAYHEDAAWRDYFRSTAAHNTVRIDGMDQSGMAGPFMWHRRAMPSRIRGDRSFTGAGLRGSHDGYSFLPDGVRHSREIAWMKMDWAYSIVDEIACGTQHLVEIFFHFSEDCWLQGPKDGVCRVENGRTLNIYLDSKMEWERFFANEAPILGWVSRSYGSRVPTHTLRGRGMIDGRAVFKTTLSLDPESP